MVSVPISFPAVVWSSRSRISFRGPRRRDEYETVECDVRRSLVQAISNDVLKLLLLQCFQIVFRRDRMAGTAAAFKASARPVGSKISGSLVGGLSIESRMGLERSRRRRRYDDPGVLAIGNYDPKLLMLRH